MDEFMAIVDHARLGREREWIHEHRNTLKKCPYCNGTLSDRTISVYQQLISALLKVYQWCGQHQRHEFMMRDIKHLLTPIDYTRFGDLVRFGGLVYKHGKASYGLNMERTKQFFNNEYAIPVQIVVDQITNETVASTYKFIKDFPNMHQLLKENGLYDPEKVIPLIVDIPNKRGLPSVEEYQQSLFNNKNLYDHNHKTTDPYF